MRDGVSAVACAPQSTTRGKLDEAAFRRPHRGILANTPEASPWKGRRILAVDGSKIALPRELADHGYRVPDGAHYPQAMAIAHRERGLHFVFRIKRNANPAFDAFIASGETERTVTLDPPVLQPLRRRPQRRRRGGRPARHAGELPERAAPRWQGDRGPLPQTGRRGQAVRRPDHGRAVALPPAGETRTQLPAKVHAAKEQVAKPSSRLT